MSTRFSNAFSFPISLPLSSTSRSILPSPYLATLGVWAFFTAPPVSGTGLPIFLPFICLPIFQMLKIPFFSHMLRMLSCVPPIATNLYFDFATLSALKPLERLFVWKMLYIQSCILLCDTWHVHVPCSQADWITDTPVTALPAGMFFMEPWVYIIARTLLPMGYYCWYYSCLEIFMLGKTVFTIFSFGIHKGQYIFFTGWQGGQFPQKINFTIQHLVRVDLDFR